MVPQTIVLPLNDSHPFIHFSALGGGVLFGLLICVGALGRNRTCIKGLEDPCSIH